jgi:hypothetical protein
MAATANKRDAQAGRARSLRCWDSGWSSRKECILADRDLLIFAFFFSLWDGFLSDLILLFSDAKTTANLYDIATEHIKHARQCAFGT